MSGRVDRSVSKGLASGLQAPAIRWPASPPASASYDTPPLNRPIFRTASLEHSRRSGLPIAKQLSVTERARAFRLIRQDDRDRFILGRFLIRSMLAELYGIEGHPCELETGAYGKPCLPDRPDIAFNISHSGDLVLIGMGCGMELGVDVEMHRSDVEYDGVGRLIFTPPECEMVFDGPQVQKMKRFFRQWVLKEALAKALGTGLSLDPRRFSIDQKISPPQVNFVGDGADDVGGGWIISDIDVGEGYSAAAAWRRRTDGVEVARLPGSGAYG